MKRAEARTQERGIYAVSTPDAIHSQILSLSHFSQSIRKWSLFSYKRIYG